MAKSDRAKQGGDKTNARITELEEALRTEKQERAEAEQRALRATERAQEADEAYRKLQLDLVAAKDEALAEREKRQAIEEKVAALEEGLAKLKADAVAKSSAPSLPPSARASRPPVSVGTQVEQMLQRIEGLREMLAGASIELSQLHADEVALGKKRARVLSDACALLARAVGATGQAPPPLPSAALEARLTIAPVVDISEVADLIESLRPPKAPRVE